MTTKLIPTPASHAVFLITQGCLPMIFEPRAIAGKSPIPARTLTAQERGKIGLTEPGVTMGYRVDQTDVFVDMAGATATIWFAGADFTGAAVLLEEWLRKIFKEEDLTLRAVPATPGKATITREIAIEPKDSRRAALLSMTFGAPDAVGDDRMFFVRIYPQERQLAS